MPYAGDSVQAQLERYQRRFRVLRGVLLATRAHRSAEGTVGAVLEEVCKGFGWPVGLYFSASDGASAGFGDTEVRYPTNGSNGNQNLVRALHERSRGSGWTFDADIRRARAPRWVPNVTVEPGFEATKHAVALGVRGLVGIPVQGAGHLYGIVEFFTREEFSPSPDQVDYLADIGSIVGAAVHFHEVARRLQKMRQEQELVFEHVKDPVYIVDPSGRVTFANPSAARLFGVSQDNLVGAQIHDLYHRTTTGPPTSAAECPLHGAGGANAGAIRRRETFRTADERHVEVEAIAAPITLIGARETVILLREP